MRRRILVVAAEKFELEWVRRNATSNADFVFTSNGPGPKLAGEAVDKAGSGFDAFVSVGLCGALVEGLGVGSIVIGDSVNGLEAQSPLPNGRGSVPVLRGDVVSIDRIAGTAEEKRELRQTGAVAVEMEAAAVQEKARAAGVPFYCIKTVSDTADETFAVDLNAARDKAGRFSVKRILAQAAVRPLVVLPELRRLMRNGRLASRSLGEFFADCRF